jgi:trimethylamine--corrinoid protein Co-methyltransferase
LHQSEIFIINGGILVQPTELAAGQSHLAMTYATLLYSDKCIMGQPGAAEVVEKVMAMSAIVFGGLEDLLEKPRVLTLVNTLTPLQLDRIALETIKVHAEHGQALLIAAGVMSGTSAPITPAGSLALGTAEVLAAIAITQMLREGTPVVMGLIVSPADMHTGEVRLGVPSHAVSFRYIRALADMYGLPCRCGGSITDATGLTHQSGYESLLNMLAARQSGVDVILHSAGILDSFRAMSFEKFVTDLEIIRIVDHYLADIKIDEDSLAFPVIEDVGPGGEFLTHRHTLAHCRDVPFASTLKKARTHEKTATAHEGYLAKVDAALDKMMSDYRQPELASGLQAEMEAYLNSEGVDASHIETINKVRATPPRHRLPT